MISERSSVKTVLQQLKQQEIISPLHAAFFEVWIRTRSTQHKIQAGEYQFCKNISPRRLMEKWVKGEVVLYSITIPEGVTLQTFCEKLSQHPKIKKTPIEIDYVANEGLYYPDTYFFSANTSPWIILQQARANMDQKISKAWENRDPNIAIQSPYEALILASIIEKETANRQEKPVISGVFQRRLEKKMRLQADPTVIYGLHAEFNGNLTKEHLRRATPYNTYTNLGLPPTPIALPGIHAIEAALHPDPSEYLYFVGKGDGTHHFSATLLEHNRAVNQYQKEKALCKPENLSRLKGSKE